MLALPPTVGSEVGTIGLVLCRGTADLSVEGAFEGNRERSASWMFVPGDERSLTSQVLTKNGRKMSGQFRSAS